MYYTNGSTITKTFHGVTFRPGETKEVFGIINDPKFVQSPIRQEPPKRVRSTPPKSEEEVEPQKKLRKNQSKSVEDKHDKDTTDTEVSKVKQSKAESKEDKPSTSDIDKKENIENKEV